MNLRAVATLTLHKASVSTTAAGTELDLQKYFVNPGKREMKAVVTAISAAVSSDSGAFDYKLQESTTTVDSDFSDISGAATTQVVDTDTNTDQVIHFYTKNQYIRGYATIGGGQVWYVTAHVFAVKRDA